MRLSIFSFKHFVFKSVAVALLLSVFYILIIQVRQPKVSFSQNQHQANMIFAQNFIYLENKPSKVIVGSSMATRMKFKPSENVYNLAFGGGGPLSGLEIIRKSGFVPEAIYIESNVFAMPVENEMMDTLFVPFLSYARGKVVALQEKYQVLNLVGEGIYRIAGRSEQEKLAQKVDKTLLDKLVKTALGSGKPWRVQEDVLKKWHQNIAYFKEKGTKILFFEMPNDTRLIQTKSREKLRKTIKDEFPQLKYREENNQNDFYKTADGIHLTLKSAMAFTEYFRGNILGQ